MKQNLPGWFMQDQEIIDAIISGEKRPFKILVERYLPIVKAFLCSLKAPNNVIEDVAQETFIKVFLNLPKYQPIRPFSAWLLKIARNTMIDCIRKCKLDRDREFELAQMTSFANENKHELDSDHNYLLETLSDFDKLLIELRFVQKLSFQEMSEITDLTENSLRVRIHRLLQKLRESIDSSEQSGK
ncbi:MAG: sigma-70 family RNA polymerase sigma factor [Candidatus Riflebacteria bacterium]|nr:sigma-70 family RNA polymerase sigma factor [Candidatus Riflebacteria bacterium]